MRTMKRLLLLLLTQVPLHGALLPCPHSSNVHWAKRKGLHLEQQFTDAPLPCWFGIMCLARHRCWNARWLQTCCHLLLQH